MWERTVQGGTPQGGFYEENDRFRDRVTARKLTEVVGVGTKKKRLLWRQSFCRFLCEMLQEGKIKAKQRKKMEKEGYRL